MVLVKESLFFYKQLENMSPTLNSPHIPKVLWILILLDTVNWKVTKLSSLKTEELTEHDEIPWGGIPYCGYVSPRIFTNFISG